MTHDKIQERDIDLRTLAEIDLDALVKRGERIEVCFRKTPADELDARIGYYGGQDARNVYICETPQGLDRPVPEMGFFHKGRVGVYPVRKPTIASVRLFPSIDAYLVQEYETNPELGKR